MTSWLSLISVSQLLALCLFQAICRSIRFSRPALVAGRWLRRWWAAPFLPPVLHPYEITSQTLSDILGRAVLIVGRQALGDGKMSSIAKISYLEIGDVRRRADRLRTHHVICKSSPADFAQALFSSAFGLHRAEIDALRRGRLSPTLFYEGSHWTGQYLLVMEFVGGRAPSIAEGLSSPAQIDAFVVELARFHKETLHLDLEADPIWARSARWGASGPDVSLLQKIVFSLIWRQTSRSYSPKEIEDRRALIEYCMAAFPDIQARALRRYPTVLAHGDLHCGNVVVTGDGRIRLIDWQASSVRPLFYDLCYFVGTSVPIEVRRRHMDRWLKLYLDEIGLGNVGADVVAECFAVCIYSVLVPLEFMPFLIKTDATNGRMHFEATGRRNLALIEDYKFEERIRALLQRSESEPFDVKASWSFPALAAVPTSSAL